MNYRTILSLSLIVAAPAFASHAAFSQNTFVNPQDVYIYAYPGTTCPGGSERYKGPDQMLAADSGAVYCRYVRKVMNVPKAGSHGVCPSGSKPYTDPRAKPDADTIWCQR
jgi:hypothetical protein